MNYKLLFWATISIGAVFVTKRLYYSRFNNDVQLRKRHNAEEYSQLRDQVYAALPIDSNDIVLIGTSITEGMPAELLGPGYKNRGITSSPTRLIVPRIDAIMKSHPKAVILETGINDFIVDELTADSAFNQVKEMIEHMQKLSPGTKLYFLSTLPTSKEYKVLMPKIKRFSGLVEALCEMRNIVWIDVFNKMGGDSGLQFTADGLHPNGEGYKIIADIVNEAAKHKPI